MASLKNTRPNDPPNPGTQHITPKLIILEINTKGKYKIFHHLTPLQTHLIYTHKTATYKRTQPPKNNTQLPCRPLKTGI